MGFGAGTRLGGLAGRGTVAERDAAAAEPDRVVTVTGTGGFDAGAAGANTVSVSDFDQNFLKIPSMITSLLSSYFHRIRYRLA